MRPHGARVRSYRFGQGARFAPLLLACGLVSARAPQVDGGQELDTQRAKTVLNRQLQAPNNGIAHALRELGEPGIQAAFGILLSSQVTDAEEQPRWLTYEERQSLLGALADQPRAVRPLLERQVEAGASEEARALALTILRPTAGPNDLDLLSSLAATEIEPTAWLSHEFHLTLCSALGRRDISFFPIKRHWNAWPRRLRAAACRCFKELDPAEAAQTAVNLLSRDGRADSDLLLDLLEEAGQRQPLRLGARPAQDLISLLDHQSLGVPARRVLGVFQVEEAIPVLIEELQSNLTEPKELDDEIFQCLRSLTDLALPSDAGRWITWYEQEFEWTQDRRPHLLRKLDLEFGSKQVEALRELADHRLGREEVASILEFKLDPNHIEATMAILHSLGRMKCASSVAPVIELLEEPTLASSARETLRQITGQELGPDEQAWLASGLAPVPVE